MFKRIGFAPRLLAVLLDGIVATLAGLAIGFALGGLVGAGVGGGAGLAADAGPMAGQTAMVGGLLGSFLGMFLGMFIAFALYGLIELFWSTTPGKAFLGYEIRRADGTAADKEALLKRFLVKNSFWCLSVLGMLLGVSLLQPVAMLAGTVVALGGLMVFGADRQTLHDKIADTAVYPRGAEAPSVRRKPGQPVAQDAASRIGRMRGVPMNLQQELPPARRVSTAYVVLLLAVMGSAGYLKLRQSWDEVMQKSRAELAAKKAERKKAQLTKKVRQPQPEREVGPFQQEDPMMSVAASPDGRLLVTGGGIGIAVWDAQTGKLIRRIRAPEFGGLIRVNTLAVAADGKSVLSLSMFDGVQRWDLANGRLLGEVPLDQPGKEMLNGRFSADGRVLAGKTMKVFRLSDVESGKTLLSHPMDETPSLVVYSADGSRVATSLLGSSGPSVLLWETDGSDKPVQVKTKLGFDLNNETVLAVHKDLVAVALGRKIELWVLPAKQAKKTWTLDGELPIQNLQFLENGQLLAIGQGARVQGSGRVTLQDVESGEVLQSQPTSGSVNQLLFLPENQRLIALSGNRLEVFRLDGRKMERQTPVQQAHPVGLNAHSKTSGQPGSSKNELGAGRATGNPGVGDSGNDPEMGFSDFPAGDTPDPDFPRSGDNPGIEARRKSNEEISAEIDANLEEQMGMTREEFRQEMIDEGIIHKDGSLNGAAMRERGMQITDEQAAQLPKFEAGPDAEGAQLDEMYGTLDDESQ